MAYGTAVKIETITVAAGGTSSIVFNNIPQTYNDLKIIASGRGTRNFETDDLVIRFNGSSTNYSARRLFSGGGAPGSSATSDTLTDIRGFVPGSPTTTDVFGNNEFYIPNYTSSNNKAVHVYGGGENNGLVSYLGFTAGLWSSASAITSITMLANNGNLTEFSTFTLYGITRIPQGAKATGGMIYDDSNYWYHAFTTTGPFTPNQALSAQILTVGGGGGGGGNIGAGGGAGAMTTFSSTSSLSSGVTYTCTIGAGGAGATTSANGANGGTTSFAGAGFSTITALGGGYGSQSSAGGNGGSGGGGGPSSPTTSGGSPSGPNTFAGGGGNYSYPYYGAGGGGGATQAGTTGTGSGTAIGGNGGQGYAISAIDSALPATGIFGSMTVIASGGGGSGVRPDNINNSATGGTGGTGAGNGGYQGTNPTNATSYGSGGGGASWENYTNGDGTNGYQGIIIVRYAK